MSKCQVCGQELKTIPAGISKTTGKPYKEFTACPNRCKQQPKQVQAPQGEGDGFKIMADEFISLRNKVDELIKEIRDSIVGQ